MSSPRSSISMQELALSPPDLQRLGACEASDLMPPLGFAFGMLPCDTHPVLDDCNVLACYLKLYEETDLQRLDAGQAAQLVLEFGLALICLAEVALPRHPP